MTKMLEIEEKKERSKFKKKDKKWWLFEIVMLCLIITIKKFDLLQSATMDFSDISPLYKAQERFT